MRDFIRFLFKLDEYIYYIQSGQEKNKNEMETGESLKNKIKDRINAAKYRSLHFWRSNRKAHWISSLVSLVLIVGILVGTFWNGQPGAFAGTYTWTQSAWNGGLDGGTGAVHGTNGTNWTTYDSKDAAVTAGASSVTLTQTTGSDQDTLTADFAGTNSNTINASDKIALTQASQEYTLTQTNNGTQAPTAPSNLTGGFNNSGNEKSSTEVLPAGTAGEDADVRLTSTTGSSYVYQSQFGSFGTSNGQFRYPDGIAIDSSGNIFVADTNNHRVQKFNSAGVYQSQFGSFGTTGNGKFNYPSGITIDSSGNIFVVDAGNNRFQKFNSDGVYQFNSGYLGTGNGQLNNPNDIATDSSGNIFVTDSGNSRVEKFSSGGNYSSQFGSYGTGNGQFDNPQGIAIDSSGNIYVADAGNKRIQKFNSAGVYQSQFGSSGTGNGQFDYPQGIAIDSSGNIFVSDVDSYSCDGSPCGDLTYRVQKFNSAGVYQSQFGSYGSGNGQFDIPQGIAIDSSGNIFVVDTNNHRFQKFAPAISYASSGTYTSYVDAGSTPSTWNTFAWGTTSDGDGSIAIKVKSTPTAVAPTYFTADGTSGGTACASTTTSPINLTTYTSNCVKTTDQYLWYQATFSNAGDTTDTPTLNDVIANVTFSIGYQTSGTYTSPIINTGHARAWGNVTFGKTDVAGGSVAVKARSCNDAACSGETALASCSALTSGNDLSSGAPTNCVTDGDQYIQYSIDLTGNGTATPSLDNITLNYYYYSQGTLTSSPYNTADAKNKIADIFWTGTETAGTDVRLQIRTASSQAGLTGSWCGPTACNGTDYYAVDSNAQTNTILAALADRSNDQWVQYKLILVPSSDGSNAPTVNSVVVKYNFNEAPTLAQASATTQSSGNVLVNYNILDIDATDLSQGSQNVQLGYQLPGVTLNSSNVTNSSTTDILINNPNSYTIPASGNILIDNELIAYTGVTNNATTTVTLTGITRAQNFTTNYPTTGAAHTAATAVYFAATQLSGTNSYGTVTGVTTSASATKTITWNAQAENSSGTSLNGGSFTGASKINLKVFANDGFTDAGIATNNIGTVSPTAVDLDFLAPTITSISSDTAAGAYNAGDIIDIDLTFSENITTTGTISVTLETGVTDRTCTFSGVTNASTATCDYTVQATDTSADLTVSAVAGTIADQAGNAMTNFVPAANMAGEDIVIDTAAPTAAITYSNNDPVKSGDSLIITATFNEALADAPIVKIALTGGNILAATNMTKVDTTHYTYTRTVGAGNGVATVELSIGTDAAGNVITAAPTSGATFEVDNTAPTTPGTATLNSYINNTGNQTVSWTQSTETNFKNYLVQRKLEVGGMFATIRTETDIATTSYADNSALAEGSYYYQVIAEDNAGNTTTGGTSDALIVDKTAPILSTFTSTTANGNYGDQAQINITATYDNAVQAGGAMTVQLDNVADTQVPLTAATEGTTLSGTYTVQATAQRTHDTADLTIAAIVAENVTDVAGNNQAASTIPTNENLGDNQNFVIDTGGPLLQSFAAESGSFQSGDGVTITANFSEALQVGSQLSVKINTGGAGSPATVVLDQRSGSSVSGTYPVQADDSIDPVVLTDLDFINGTITNVRDANNNPADALASMPASGTFSNTSLDNTDPIASFSDDVAAGPVQADNVVINVTETHPGSYKYIFSADNNCSAKSDDTYAAGENFSSGGTISLTNENNNDKYLCARIADLSGNKIYLASAEKVNVDVTAPIADTIKLDRSADSDQLQFTGVADKNADDTDRGITGLQMRIQTLASEVTACDLSSSTYVDYTANVTVADISSVLKACVQFKDVAGNESQVYSTYTPENPANFKATDISNLDLTPDFRGVFLTWQIPDVLGEGGIDYFEVKNCSTAADQSNCTPDTQLKTVAYTDPVTNYDYSHNDLVADTKYCYNVRFKDLNGNYSKYSSTKCVVPGFGSGKLSTITMLYNAGGQAGDPKVLTDKKAVIAFDTDQPAKCTIQYDTEAQAEADVPDYQERPVSETDYNYNHSMHLPDLVFSTPYFYLITCADSGATAISASEYTFTTLATQMTEAEANGDDDAEAPEISSVSVTNITGESATVTWTTTEEANSLVKFGVASIDENVAGNAAVNFDVDNYVTSHSVIIHNLIPATKYMFMAGSLDAAGNIAQSSQSSFTTKAPSSLSAVKVVSKNLGQAIVTWETSSATSSLVEYGLTTAYGDDKQSGTKTKEHEITLAGLKAKTTYHFRVKGTDVDGNLFASSDNTFEPKSPPAIDGFKISSVTEHGVMVSFTTDVPTDALITYADLSDAENTGSQGKPELTSKHAIELKTLTSGTTYSLKIRVRDEMGNETEENFPNFTTGKDENPPKLDNIKTDSALAQSDKVQSIISWVTDEPATTEVIYKEGRAGQEKNFKVPGGLVTNHVAVITSFAPGRVYYFNAKSEDAAGNESKSGDFALLTPKVKENIVQIIIGNFQDIFSWAKL